MAGNLQESESVSIEAQLGKSGLPLPPRLAWLEIDLSTLAANAQTLRSVVPIGTELGIVVKADGYGHGLEAAAHAALLGGADSLIVATLDEALALRMSGVMAPILVVYPVPRWAIETALEARLDLVALDWASLADLKYALDAQTTLDSAGSATRRDSNRPAPRVHLGIDTGMARGGFSPDDALRAARELLDVGGLAGVWSHLATPEDREQVAAQVRRFELAVRRLAVEGISAGSRHVAASGGLLGATCPPYDLVRIGLAFYGYIPSGLHASPKVRSHLRPAMTLKARTASLATVAAGTRVGYGGDWVADRDSVIAVLPVGYADGWTRLYQPGSEALIRGSRFPLVGRVSSDAITLDVTDVPNFGLDTEVVLLGGQAGSSIAVDELAQRRGSIAWEVLDNFTERLPRIYMQGGVPVAVRYLGGRTVWAAGFDPSRDRVPAYDGSSFGGR